MQQQQERDRFLKRLAELEERVFGAQNLDLQQGSNLSRKAAHVRISKLEEEAKNVFAKSFEQYLVSYKKSPVYLRHNWEYDSLVTNSLDTDEHLELLRAGEADMTKTVEQLEEIGRLKEFINPDRFQNLGQLMERVNAIDPSFPELVRRSKVVHDRVGVLTNQYDKMIDLISEKLVRWDEALRKREKQKPP